MNNVSTAEHYHDAALIARGLGLPRWKTIGDVELVDHIARGLPVASVERVARSIDPTGGRLEATDIVPKSTLHRKDKANKPLSSEDSDKVVALLRVAIEAKRIYGGDWELALMFLVLKHPMLGHRPPIDVAISSVAGADLVLKILRRLDAGVAA